MAGFKLTDQSACTQGCWRHALHATPFLANPAHCSFLGISRGRSGRLLASCSTQQDPGPSEDPKRRTKEADKSSLSTHGKHHASSFENWLGDVPRVRVRNLSDRQMEQLGELVIANERLAGRPTTAVRTRIEFLKRRREVWEGIYNIVTKQDAAATLAAVEEANQKVRDAVSEQSRERQSVSALKKQLVELQAKVAAAHEQLHETQDLVELNRARIQQATAEASALEGRSAERTASTSQPGAPPELLLSEHTFLQRPATGAQPQAQSAWVPAAFCRSLQVGSMVTFQHAGQPWLLFRDGSGAAACIEDCCAHRACPLSLGKVVEGEVQCPYHGWQYDAEGKCTRMPSTMHCPGIRVNSLACLEASGLIWVAEPQLASQHPPPEPPLAPPEFSVVFTQEVEVGVEASVLADHILSVGSIVAGSIQQGGNLPMWLRTAAASLLGAQGDSSASMPAPGWIACQSGGQQGGHVHELHSCSPSQPGRSHWLYQLAVSREHWSATPAMHVLWQQYAAQVLQATVALLDQSQSNRAGLTAV